MREASRSLPHVEPTLRPAAPGDADEIAMLFSSSLRLLTFLPELHTMAEDRAFIAEQVLPRQRVTVAEQQGRIVGFMAESGDWIHHLYVVAARLHAGIGSTLLADAKRRNEVLQLWCFAENHRGCAFYEKHGFVAVERTDGAGNEFKAPDIRFQWCRHGGTTPVALINSP